MMGRRSWYYFTMLLFLSFWIGCYFFVQHTIASDLAIFMLAALILFTTLCGLVVFRGQGKPDSFIVNYSHMLASYGMRVGLCGWVPAMAYVKTYTDLHGGARPLAVFDIAAFLTGMLVLISGIALIYQYVLYGLTWLLLRAGIVKE